MAFSLHKYYETINVTASGQPLWNPPDQTVLWPTYFTLVTAVITSVFSAVILVTYFWSTTAAERIDDWRFRILLLALLLKVALEITTSSGMYATGAHGPADGPQSLWYQTCTATSDDVSLFSFAVNIPQICTMQVCAPLSLLIIEMGEYIRTFVDHFGCFVCGDVRLLVSALETQEADEETSFNDGNSIHRGQRPEIKPLIVKFQEKTDQSISN